jgi:RNA polymerase sigma factor (sigma-70 family)
MPGPLTRTWSLAGAAPPSDTSVRVIRLRPPRPAATPAAGARPAADPTMPPMLPDDEATAQRSKDRFRDAVLPHLDDAYNLARYLTRNGQDADDVVQEAYLRAFRFFPTFRGDNARAWLLAIVRNCFYSSLKSRPRGDTASLTDVDLDTLNSATVTSDLWASDAETPEQTLMRLDDVRVVRALIETLPTQFREALVLREMEEMSYQDIAVITDVPIGTVMSRLARARQLFKAAWIDHQDRNGQDKNGQDKDPRR